MTTTDQKPEVAAAIATLKAAGIDSASEIADLLTAPEPPTPVPDLPGVAFAKATVDTGLRRLADQAAVDAGVDTIPVDATRWASVLVDKLVAEGLVVPVEWADRPAYGKEA